MLEAGDTVRLGRTGLDVFPVAYGAWQFGGEWGRVDERQAMATVRRARELGVNLFDTAQSYGFGASERLLGRALRDDLDHRREEVVIATKGGMRLTEQGAIVRDSSPAWLRRGVEQSLRALGVDHIDIYQLHWPDPAVPFAETAAALGELVDEGKIRHLGASNFDSSLLEEFARFRRLETLQPPFNLLRRGVEAELLPYCRRHEIGVLAYAPLAHGLLTGTFDESTVIGADDWRSEAPAFAGEDFRRNVEVVGRLRRFAAEQFGVSVSRLAIAWILADPAVQVAIVGARKSSHIEDSIGSAELRLSATDLERIEEIVADAIPLSGSSPEARQERKMRAKSA